MLLIIELVFWFCDRHHQHGRWQARIGRVAGNKDLYLGTFSKLVMIYMIDVILHVNLKMGYIYISFIEINDVVNVGTQEEPAEAYDSASIKFRGLNAVTNFDMSRYDVKSILESSTLPIGGPAKRLKDVEEDDEDSRHRGKNRRLN